MRETLQRKLSLEAWQRLARCRVWDRHTKHVKGTAMKWSCTFRNSDKSTACARGHMQEGNPAGGAGGSR